MDMYNDQRQKIGTKTVTQGGGIQRPDGSFGNHIAMKFNPPPQQAQAPTQQQSQMFNNSYGTMGGGVNAPKLQYETPTEGMTSTENQSRIIRNLARKRNATMQLEYDKMNSNMYNQQQDRVSRESIADNQLKQNESQFVRKSDIQAQQFDRTLDANTQQNMYTNALRNVMTPYQQQTIKQKRQKTITDGGFDNLLPKDFDKGSNEYEQAKKQYLESGTVPNFKLTNKAWWGDNDYEIVDGDVSQQQQQQMPQYQNTTYIDSGDKNAYELWKAKKLNEQIMSQ